MKINQNVTTVKQRHSAAEVCITHTLTLTQVKVVHAVGHEDIVQQREARVLVPREEGIVSVRPIHVPLCPITANRNIQQPISFYHILSVNSDLKISRNHTQCHDHEFQQISILTRTTELRNRLYKVQDC